VTISDDRRTSPKFLAFAEKLLSRHYWTADDYDSIPDELIVEIYDGGIYVVPSPSPDHQATVLDLAMAFREALGGDRRRILFDIDVNVLGKLYKPDVVVLREGSSRQPTPGELLQVVVEVISPNENIERSAKMKAYAAQGIPVYIIVDGKPREHFAEVYRLEGDEYRLTATVQPDARAEFDEPFPFVLDMTRINR
jgi:Uma2 family endonuclease